MTMGSSGIYGTPLYTSASSLFYFMLFGVFFSECGGGQLLIDLGMKASKNGAGGPAKAAVISSGLMGMISGSAVANVATTGVMTIPMMKKTGYEPHQAGAIEAVASTGGQIMPPIMGVGAFIMAEMLGEMCIRDSLFSHNLNCCLHHIGISDDQRTAFIVNPFVSQGLYRNLRSYAGRIPHCDSYYQTFIHICQHIPFSWFSARTFFNACLLYTSRCV